MDSFLSSSCGTPWATAVSQEVVTASPGAAQQLTETRQSLVQWCLQEQMQGRKESRDGKEKSPWTREQQHEHWGHRPGPVHLQVLQVCRHSPARCRAVIHSWLWRTSKPAWRRRQERDETGMFVHWEWERHLVFPLPASPCQHFAVPAQQRMLSGLSRWTAWSRTDSTIKQRGGKKSKTLQEFITGLVPAITNRTQDSPERRHILSSFCTGPSGRLLMFSYITSKWEKDKSHGDWKRSWRVHWLLQRTAQLVTHSQAFGTALEGLATTWKMSN